MPTEDRQMNLSAEFLQKGLTDSGDVIGNPNSGKKNTRGRSRRGELERDRFNRRIISKQRRERDPVDPEEESSQKSGLNRRLDKDRGNSDCSKTKKVCWIKNSTCQLNFALNRQADSPVRCHQWESFSGMHTR